MFVLHSLPIAIFFCLITMIGWVPGPTPKSSPAKINGASSSTIGITPSAFFSSASSSLSRWAARAAAANPP
jgi:hypothetical protein